MNKKDKATLPDGSDPRLAEALVVFRKGDYVRARAMLQPLIADTTRPEGERAQAQRVYDATRLDRAVPLTALACLGLLGLIVLVTTLFQP